MSIDEAIKELEFLKRADFHVDSKEALEMAIEALKFQEQYQVPVTDAPRELDKDLMEIDSTIKLAEERDNTFTSSVLQRAKEIIVNLKNKDIENQYKVQKCIERIEEKVNHCIGMNDWRGQSELDDALEIIKEEMVVQE